MVHSSEYLRVVFMTSDSKISAFPSCEHMTPPASVSYQRDTEGIFYRTV